MPWGEVEETVSWVGASGLGVSGGEAIGPEKTQGSTLCREKAPPKDEGFANGESPNLLSKKLIFPWGGRVEVAEAGVCLPGGG